jgi:hypothetical protein
MHFGPGEAAAMWGIVASPSYTFSDIVSGQSGLLLIN